MRIGFDAKRAFYNRSGLGNYSRDTIRILTEFFPANDYFLFSPKITNAIRFIPKDVVNIVTPNTFAGKTFQSYWRSFSIKDNIIGSGVEIYHGLSNELPHNIRKTGVKTVVTIHDLIFLRYPKLYKPIDRYIYNKKFSNSCKQADVVVAVSEQTKSDIIRFYNIAEDKIKVVYQGCNESFLGTIDDAIKQDIKRKYNLPDGYILCVGTIEERKNQLAIVRAIHLGKIDYPVVIMGKPTKYLNSIKEYIAKHKLNKVIFLHDIPFQEFPGIYQMAKLFVYPSIFEGFGIPIIEALNSKIPVITSRDGCFHEAGGPSSIYIDPRDPDELAEVINAVINDVDLREKMIISGLEHASKFSKGSIANNLMDLYLNI